MKEYSVYVEYKPWEGAVYVHMGRWLERDHNREYLTIKDGHILSNMINGGELTPDDGHFLRLPIDVYESLEKGIIQRVEQRGGAETQQSLRGQVKQMEDEIKWLRETLGALLYKSQ